MSDKIIKRWNKLAGILVESGPEKFSPTANTAIGPGLRTPTGVAGKRSTEKVTDAGLLRSRAGSGGQKQAEIILKKLLERGNTKPTIDIAGISASGTPDLGIRLDRGENSALFNGLSGRTHSADDFPIYGAFNGWAIEVKAGGGATIDVGSQGLTIQESVRHEDGFIFFNKGNSACKIVIFELELYQFLQASPLWGKYGSFVGYHDNRARFSQELGNGNTGMFREGRYEVAINYSNMPTGVQINPAGTVGAPATESVYVGSEGWDENPVVPYIAQVCDAYDDGSQTAALNTLFNGNQTLIRRWIRTCRTFNKDGHSAVPVFLYSNKVWPWISNVTPEKATEKEREANAFLNRNATKILKRFFGYTAAQLSEGGPAPLALLNNASNKVLQLPVKSIRGKTVTHYDSIDKIMRLSATVYNQGHTKTPSGRAKNIALPAGFVADFKRLCQEAYDACVRARNKALIAIARVEAFTVRMKSAEILGVDEDDNVNLTGTWWTECERRAQTAAYKEFNGSDASFWQETTTIAPPPPDSTGKGTAVGREGDPDTTPPDEITLTPEEEQSKANTEETIEQEAVADPTTAAAMKALADRATEQLATSDVEAGFRGLSGKGSRTKRKAFVTAMLGGSNPKNLRTWSNAKPRLQQIQANIASASLEELNAIVTLLEELGMENGDLKSYITAKFSTNESKKRSLKYMLLEMSAMDFDNLEDNAEKEISALFDQDIEDKFEALDADGENQPENQSEIVAAHRKIKYSITSKLLGKK